MKCLIQEFISFLGTCGSEFDQVSKEQRAMTKDQKLKYASQRLSTRVLSVPIKSSDEVEDVPDKANDGEEGVWASDFVGKALNAIVQTWLDFLVIVVKMHESVAPL